MQVIFFMMFFLIFCMFIFVFSRNIGEWHKNNHSPRLSVNARIINKRRATHHHNHNGHHHSSHTYHATFEFESGDSLELKIPRNDYNEFFVGDDGVLHFQGTRYLGFERDRKK